jgi:hypothetical protein
MTSNAKAPAGPPVPATIGGSSYANLLDELDRESISWTPEPGSKVAGIVVGITTATSEYGSYPLVTLDPGPNEPLVLVHCFHAWLKRDIVGLAVREGDTLAVKFLDRNGPRDAARYKVAIRRTGAGSSYQMDETATINTDRVEQLFEEPF